MEIVLGARHGELDGLRAPLAAAGHAGRTATTLDELVASCRRPAVTGVLICLDDDATRRALRELAGLRRGFATVVVSTTLRAVDVVDDGADDCVALPVDPADVLARLRAILRRLGRPPGEVNGVRVDAASRQAWLRGSPLALTPKEFDLLAVLVREAGSVVSRDQLMREVWDTDWWSSTKTVDMHVSWLRRKLGDDAADPRLIATVRGVGFRFERRRSRPGGEEHPAAVGPEPERGAEHQPDAVGRDVVGEG